MTTSHYFLGLRIVNWKASLFRKKFDRYADTIERRTFLEFVFARSLRVSTSSKLELCRDSKDNAFLELAVDGRADFIVTGDDDLLILKSVADIPIVTPDLFLKLVAQTE